MAGAGITPPKQRYGYVQPREGFPVQNQGGMPQTPTVAPPKPFVTSPTVAPPPGPNKTPPTPGGYIPGVPTPGAVPGAPPPATAPAVPTPAPPAPAPSAPPTAPAPSPASTSTSSTTSTSGQSGVISQPAQWNLESQLQNYLSGAFQNSVSPEFINRAKGDVFRTVQGQTKQATNQINEDAIRRGIYRSGIPAESIANVQGQAQGAMSRGLADILNAAEAQNIQGRQQAGSLATNLLGMNREQARYEQQRADEQAARAAAAASGGPKTFTYIDPETGQSYELDESWF